MAERQHILSLSTLGHRLRSVPMLVVLIPFALGIALYESYALPLVGVVAALLLSAAMAWFVLPRRVAWCYAALALMLLGYSIAELRAPRPAMEYGEATEMVLRIETHPEEREGYHRADGRITAWRDREGLHHADDRVVAWIRSDSIGYGDEVLIYGSLTERLSRHESYNRLLHRRGMVGGVSISNYNTLSINHTELTPSLQQRATARLRSHMRDTTSYAAVEAMVAGSRHLMTDELRDAYSKTGLAHLMAVSGLHLGIVMMVVGVILAPLSFIRRGHHIANILTIIALWLFAAMSGLSPSVVRAALMLTILQISLFSSEGYNSLNALAAAAFAMLVYRPDYLYDISFDLSVAAVMGIVVWAVPLMHYTAGRSWLTHSAATTLYIGLAATLWTLPLISYTFGNIPIASIVVTPIVMMFAYMVVIFGIFTLILPTPIASLTMAVAEGAASIQNSIVEYAATLPFADIGYTMDRGEVALCYTLYIVITLLIWSINRKKVISLSYDDTSRDRAS